jgi:hypothetical protein
MVTVPETKEKVQQVLTKFGSPMITENGAYTLRNGSSQFFVEVSDWGDEDTWIRVISPVLLGAKESPELFEYVALNSDRYKIGTLSAMREDAGITLFLSHGILGTYLDAPELERTVVLIAETADEIDDELQGRFGGHRFHEDA